ncbi:Uncharacterized protein M6B38_215885 [Iris pallida]|uniref:Nodulin-like domain-containing protein n=1 Tax=Iris pallida TaxID=29817 RepID=A0AAX6E129_IRIPA|nr:Uncharacterized protein M6B38_215885 [Iris pallida]
MASALGFVAQVLRGRWMLIFACFLLMSAAGTTYIFGIYSKDLKSSLGYDQQTLNTLSFYKDLGANINIVSGLINEVTPPWVVLSMGAAMNLFGYLMIYLAITGRLAPRPKVWQMCLYIYVGANSQSFASTGALVTCVKNVPDNRGMLLGLLKGFLGLSGAIFHQLYLAFYGGDDSKSLVLLIAWLPSAIAVLSLPIVRIMEVVKTVAKESAKPFYCFLYISLALVAYLTVMIIVQKSVAFSRPEYAANAAVVVFLLFLPLGVVIKEELRIWKQKKKLLHALANPRATTMVVVEKPMAILPAQPEPEPDAAESSSSSSSKPNKSAFVSWMVRTFRAPMRGEDYTIPQALASIDMIVLVFAVVAGVGGTLTAIDNMGQIGESLGYPAKSVGTFVSLISIWNCLGRLASGFLSEILLTRYKFPRPLVLALVILVSCVGHLLIAFGVPGSLYFSSVVIGFCFGAQAPIILAIISEIFGLKYYSTLYNFGSIATPLGTYILNIKVTGRLYDLEAAKQNHGVKEATCIGTQCFKHAFLVITAATLVGAAASFILVWRSWSFYKGDVYAKFRVAAESAVEGDNAVVASAETNNTSALKEKDENRPYSNKDHQQNGNLIQ